jgi:DNA-binding HxlR family transcriptional regulator
MAKRSYAQHCPLACALDLVGERWTLLIVRDLVSGPKRYTDLQRGLPGLASDLLTERLRRLEDADVVRRRPLPSPASGSAYELTERGRELEPAIFALARFGFGLLGDPPDAGTKPPTEHIGLVLRMLFDPEHAPADPETWVLAGNETSLAVTVGPEGVEVSPHADELPEPAAATFSGDVPAIYDLVMGRLDPTDAVADGRLTVEGDRGALRRMRAAFPAP